MVIYTTDKLLQWTITGYTNTSFTVSNMQSTACWAQFIPKVLKKDLAYLWFIYRHFAKIHSRVVVPTKSSGTKSVNDELKLVMKKTVMNGVCKSQKLWRMSTKIFIQNRQCPHLKMESKTHWVRSRIANPYVHLDIHVNDTVVLSDDTLSSKYVRES
jgi:hypothetical protein